MRDELNFLHVDLDAFFASCEEIFNPKLKTLPVVVGGQSNRGIITTANYEARKYGLHSAMPIFQAKKLCPHVVIVPPRIQVYGKISKRIFELLEEFSPTIEKMSIDEGCLDISHLDKDPVELAKAIQQRIFSETKLTLSVGISYNKSMAKLASDWKKPKGITIITPSQAKEFLHDLPIEKIGGIGKMTSQRLHDNGVYKVKDLLNIPLDVLEYHFGKLGNLIYHRARGIDHRKVDITRERKSMGVERTFSQDIDDHQTLSKKIHEFSHELERDLENKRLIGKTLSLKIKFNDFTTITRNFTMTDYTRDHQEITEKALHLLKSITLTKPIRLLGLSMSNLREDNLVQLRFRI